MGFPVCQAFADAAGVELMRWDDILDSSSRLGVGHEAIGNSMFVPNVGIVTLSVLASIQVDPLLSSP